MRRRRPAAGATISLFPFLAVLLCTMGALLVLLVIFSRRARESEDAAALAADHARAEEAELARDELRWRLDQLRGVRERTASDLARERMRLAGIEEDARKLADEIETLERTAVALETERPEIDATDTSAAERRLAAARAALDEAKAEGVGKPAAYAVVPYQGANGTHRRPLYVECCLDGVFLQPEGIRLGPGDFEGAPGPGNPLASALRAAREHLARSPGESGDPAAQPYPLLLVRPSGVMAYYAAREALTSWGSEFGYQFVDEDWELKYPPADPALAAAEQRAIDESRRRMEWLAQVRPARPTRPTQQYRASTTRGGVVAEGGPSVLGDQSRFDWTEEQAGAGKRGAGAGGNGTGAGPGGGDVVLGSGGGGVGHGVGRPGNAAAGSAPGDRYAGPSRFYAGQPAAAGPGEADGAGPPGGSRASGDVAGTGGVAGSGGPADGAAAGRSATGGTPQGGSASGGLATGGGGTAAAAGRGADGGVGGWAGGSSGGSTGTSAGGATGSAGGSGLASGANAGGSAGGPALPGMAGAAGATAAAGSAASGAGSLAGSRGSNWASLATAERPIPLTRPIRIECAAEEFRVLDDGGTRVETRIPIGTRTADSVDPLVQAIHGRVGRWGLAGERMYWRPELVLAETADGRQRREDLERLLADSGLDTRRVERDVEVKRLPPVTRTSAALPRR